MIDGRAAITTPHRLASEAGLRVLREGGNALDAAIAANLTLGVVAPYLCGYGGDLFAMIWADGALHAYNGSGRAPAAATVEATVEAVGEAQLPPFGAHTVTVPGAVEAWFALLARFGTRSFEQLCADALRRARDGVAVTPMAAAYLDRSRAYYAGEREWSRIYGSLTLGDPMRQPELAATIEALRLGGPDVYYRGPVGRAIVAELRARGALMSEDDLDAHRGDWVEPLRARYRDVEVVEMPPNTQGVTALEALRIVDGLPETAPDSEERHHLLLEAAKLALADRNQYVGDPEAMALTPDTLLDDEWIEARRARIDPARAGVPLAGRAAAGGTASLCAADEGGMLVSLIQSNYTGFGSGVTVPGWGVNLHNRGSFFALDPSHVNAVAPRRRTLHTLIPAMAFRRGAPWLVFGTMGGDAQAVIHLQLLVRIVDDGLAPQPAIDAPRWVVSPSDWSVIAERRFSAALLEGLRARGHRVQLGGEYDAVTGHAHAILIGDRGYEAATDPRAEGAALVL